MLVLFVFSACDDIVLDLSPPCFRELLAQFDAISSVEVEPISVHVRGGQGFVMASLIFIRDYYTLDYHTLKSISDIRDSVAEYLNSPGFVSYLESHGVSRDILSPRIMFLGHADSGRHHMVTFEQRLHIDTDPEVWRLGYGHSFGLPGSLIIDHFRQNESYGGLLPPHMFGYAAFHTNRLTVNMRVTFSTDNLPEAELREWGRSLRPLLQEMIADTESLVNGTINDVLEDMPPWFELAEGHTVTININFIPSIPGMNTSLPVIYDSVTFTRTSEETWKLN